MEGEEKGAEGGEKVGSAEMEGVEKGSARMKEAAEELSRMKKAAAELPRIAAHEEGGAVVKLLKVGPVKLKVPTASPPRSDTVPRGEPGRGRQLAVKSAVHDGHQSRGRRSSSRRRCKRRCSCGRACWHPPTSKWCG